MIICSVRYHFKEKKRVKKLIDKSIETNIFNPQLLSLIWDYLSCDVNLANET